MEIRNHTTSMVMLPGLKDWLEEKRQERGFKTSEVLEAKAILLNHYLRNAKLSSVVIAVSGGIDSAVVLGIAHHAAQKPSSPIKKILAVSLPCYDNAGVTGQNIAESDAKVVADHFGIPLHVINMQGIVNSIISEAESVTGMKANDWAAGQVVSYARTPTYYFCTSLLSASGMPGVVLGTTNLSEGGYLGYFGKASDGMVDVQMISDLYKSEVYEIAKVLGVPQKIIDKAPTGDMFDATTDEVVFGAPYDFVELYQEILRTGANDHELDDEDLVQFTEYADNLERMHAYNAHKYLGRSPAVHLDILPCAVPGGWNNEPPALPIAPVQHKKLVNYQPVLAQLQKKLHRPTSQLLNLSVPEASGMMVPHLLTQHEAQELLQDLRRNAWVGVGLDGKMKEYLTPPEEIRNYRLTMHDQNFADVLFSRLQPNLPALRFTDDSAPTDHDGHPLWTPVGVSPVFRAIAYPKGGALIPHYDATFIENDRRRTLMSLVIYLTDGEDGATRFIKDPQAALPVKDRDLNDWNREATDQEILFQVQPETGLAILFDHCILHDSQRIEGAHEKIILRTDVIFERRDWYLP